MKAKKIYLYVCDTMSDWEIGYLMAELNSGRYFKEESPVVKVITVAKDRNSITTMGGLKILPDISIEECTLETTDVLILPGANTWIESIHDDVLEKAKIALERGSTIAAICGATIGLAMKGLLDVRNHTSNNLEYLKEIAPNYSGEKYYKYEPSVADENLITASGIAPLEFTMQVLKALDIFKSETLKAWYNLYKTQEPKYYFELMESIK